MFISPEIMSLRFLVRDASDVPRFFCDDQPVRTCMPPHLIVYKSRMTSAVAAQGNGLRMVVPHGQPLVDDLFQVVHSAGGARRNQTRRVLVACINSKTDTYWHILPVTIFHGLPRSTSERDAKILNVYAGLR